MKIQKTYCQKLLNKTILVAKRVFWVKKANVSAKKWQQKFQFLGKKVQTFVL